MSSNEAFKETVKSLFDGMESHLSSKSVIGDPIVVGDTTIVPLIDITFGLGAGTGRGRDNLNAGGGMGGKVTPTAVLIIKEDTARVINIANSSGMDKLLDIVPDFVNKFTKKTPGVDPAVKEAAAEAMTEMIFEASDGE